MSRVHNDLNITDLRFPGENHIEIFADGFDVEIGDFIFVEYYDLRLKCEVQKIKYENSNKFRYLCLNLGDSKE